MANPTEKKKNQVTKNRDVINFSFDIQALKKPAKFQMEREKMALVVFGAGMFEKDLIKLKGNRCGVTGVFWRALKRREAAGELIAITIDECKTPKVCNACSSDLLARMSELKGCSVLVCNTCKTLWQQNVNACKNMLSTSLLI
jgi:hypothetical protein